MYDPANPRKVYCENDQLGEIFGCEEFSTSNACELLLENLESVSPTTNSSEPHSSKQTVSNFPCVSTTDAPATCSDATWSMLHQSMLQGHRSDETCSCSDSDQQSTSDLCSNHSLLPWPAGVKQSYESALPGTSSVLDSVPGTSCIEAKDGMLATEYMKHYKGIDENSTDVVTDTSDDLFFVKETDEDQLLESTEDENNAIIVTQSSNDEDEFAVEYEPISFSDEERLLAIHGFDQEAAGDSGDTEIDKGEDGGDELGNSDSSDSEIEDDKWQCESCSQRNHPVTRRCERCWAVRRDWFLPSLDITSSDRGVIRNETAQID